MNDKKTELIKRIDSRIRELKDFWGENKMDLSALSEYNTLMHWKHEIIGLLDDEINDLYDKEEKNILISKEDTSFILTALNAYFHQAVDHLSDSSNLGDLEKVMYQQQRDRSRELMNKIQNITNN